MVDNPPHALAPMSFAEALQNQSCMSGYGYWGTGMRGYVSVQLKSAYFGCLTILCLKNTFQTAYVSELITALHLKFINPASSKARSLRACSLNLICLRLLYDLLQSNRTDWTARLPKRVASYSSKAFCLAEQWTAYVDQNCFGSRYGEIALSLNQTLSRPSGIGYCIRGAGFFSEMLAIVDCVAYAMIHGIGFRFLDYKTGKPWRLEEHDSYSNFLHKTICSLSSVPIGEQDCNHGSFACDYSHVHGWERQNIYTGFQSQDLNEMPLFILRACLLKLIFPIKNLQDYLILLTSSHDLSSPVFINDVHSVSCFLRFGDKIACESVGLADEQIIAGIASFAAARSSSCILLLSDDNRAVARIISKVDKAGIQLKLRNTFLYSSEGYDNNQFQLQASNYSLGVSNIIYNLLTLLSSSVFIGNPGCNLVNAAAMYSPKKYQPSLLYPYVPQ